MQKYVIIHFLEQIEDGTQFPMTKWPLHITIAPNFVINKTASELEELLADFCETHAAVKAAVGEDDHFGPEGQVHVTKLEMNPNLMAMHKSLISLLKTAGAIFDDPQYVEDGYIAHATVQYDKRINKGEVIAITYLSLVDMFADNDIRERKKLRTFSLK